MQEKDGRLSLGTVFSLVANPGTTDARVMKQARALIRAGYRVRIYSRLEQGCLPRETVDEIEIVRFDCYSFDEISVQDLEAVLESPDLIMLFDDKLKRAVAINANLQTIAPHYADNLSHLREVGARVTELKRQREEWRAHLASHAKSAAGRKFLGFLEKIKIKIFKASRVDAMGYRSIVDELSAAIETRDRIRESMGGFERVKELNKELQGCIFYMRYVLFAANLVRLKHDIKPNIIHAHDLYTLVGAVALGSSLGAKVIFDAHEIETERVPPLAPEKKNFIDQLERSLLDKVDQVITCCDSSKDFYTQRFSTRIPQVVMNAPDFCNININSLTSNSVLNLREALKLPKNSRMLIYTGGIGREGRGLDKVVIALKYLSNVHLIILGPRHRLNDIWLQEVARNEGVLDQLHLFPSVPAEHVVDVIRTADVGVCPIQDVSLSYRYAMPNKLFEMTFANVPICVSNLPEMAKFVQRLGNGLVMDETDPHAIASAIRQVLGCPEQYKLTAQSSVILDAEYSWKVQAQKLINTYSDIAGDY